MGNPRITGYERNLSGWRRDRPDHRDAVIPMAILPAVIPASVDLSASCTPVEDQKELGSCSACAATSCMEFVHVKDGGKFYNLSRLFVYYYARRIERCNPSEDSGVTLRDAMKCLSHFGAPDEALWPYDTTKFATPPSYAAIRNAHDHRVTRYLRCDDIHAIKRSLAAGYTCVGGFSVPESCMTEAVAMSGEIPMPLPDERIVGGHSVHFVGYDDTRQALRLQNSWGLSWGCSGYGWLPYGYVVKGLADDFWTIRREM